MVTCDMQYLHLHYIFFLHIRHCIFIRQHKRDKNIHHSHIKELIVSHYYIVCYMMTNQMVLKQNNKMYFYFTCTIEVYPGEEIGKELHQIKRYVTFTHKEVVLFM